MASFELVAVLPTAESVLCIGVVWRTVKGYGDDASSKWRGRTISTEQGAWRVSLDAGLDVSHLARDLLAMIDFIVWPLAYF
jgi:hypothetical protein